MTLAGDLSFSKSDRRSVNDRESVLLEVGYERSVNERESVGTSYGFIVFFDIVLKGSGKRCIVIMCSLAYLARRPQVIHLCGLLNSSDWVLARFRRRHLEVRR